MGSAEGEQEGQRGHGQASGDVGPEQERPAGEAVRDGPAQQQENDLGGGGGQADIGKGRGPVRNGVGQPRDGNDKNAVPQEGNGHAGPQQPEVSPAQRCR